MAISANQAHVIKLVYEVREEILNAEYEAESSKNDPSDATLKAIEKKMEELTADRTKLLEGYSDKIEVEEEGKRKQMNPIDFLIEAEAFSSIKKELESLRSGPHR